MFLFANSALVSVVALFHLIDFFVVVYIFLAFCMPANTCLQPDILNFTFSGARYFCIPVNVLELYTGMQLIRPARGHLLCECPEIREYSLVLPRNTPARACLS